MKAKVYKCPNKCHNKNFPPPKWKTEKGFNAHMLKCPNRPEAIAKREETERLRRERWASENKAAIDRAEHKVGDTIYYVKEVCIKQTHDHWGRKIRYEAVNRYDSKSDKVKTVGAYNGQTIYNSYIYPSDIFPSKELAQWNAASRQESHDAHLKQSSDLR